MIIRSASKLEGAVVVPGDKSISHRSVIVAALAEGRTTIDNFASGEDCGSTIRCLKQLGVKIERHESTVIVDGVGRSGLKKPSEPLDCGNSGTTMRLLAGVLAGQDFETILTGDQSLRRRPMDRIIVPLEQMGAEIRSDRGFAPLQIRGRSTLRAIRYQMPVASAQVKSCILFAGLNANGGTTVVEPNPTRDHTERMLRRFGADLEIFNALPHLHDGDDDNVDSLVEDDFGLLDAADLVFDMRGEKEIDLRRHEKRTRIFGDSKLTGQQIRIPGDLSSAAFFMAAAACLPGSSIKLPEISVNTTRSNIIDALLAFGADVSFNSVRDVKFEPQADLAVHGPANLRSRLVEDRIGGSHIAGLIDEIPILAIVGTRLENGLTFRDARELRFKETDRITAICKNLRRMGAEVEEFDEGFSVKRSELRGAEVDSFGDHRIAMAFAVAGLLAQGETIINGHECADISFPGFYETLESVVKR